MNSNYNNPIIDGRIVHDKTFAVRLKSFVENTDVNDAMSEEEKDYLLYVADKLIKYQVSTVESGSNEEIYLKRLNLK